MGRTSRCSGCKMPHSEHAFGKQGKNCTGPEQPTDVFDVDRDTASPSQSGPVETTSNKSTEATLASSLGVVQSLTIGLKEVQANNQQLHALLTNQSLIKEVPVPTTSSGGAMQDLSQQADQRVAQLGLVDSSDSDLDHGDVEVSAHICATPKSASNGSGKCEVREGVKLPSLIQLWPHSFLSLTNACRDIKYDEQTLEEFIAGYVSSNPPTLWRASVPLGLSIWYPSSILPSSTSGKLYLVFTGLCFWKSREVYSSGAIHCLI